VLGGFLLVHLVVVEVAFFTVGAGKNATLTVAKFFALHAATLMMLQLILIARLPFLDRRLGMDRLTRWHRWVGFTLFWTVLTHASIVVLGYARLDNAPLLKTFLGTGRGRRVPARHDRRDDHRRDRRDVRQVPATAVVLRGLARHPHGRLPRGLHRARAPVPRRHHVLQPVGAGLLVDGVGAGDRRVGRGPGGDPAAPQRPARVPGGGCRPGRPERHLGVRHGPRPRQAAGRAGQFCIWRFPDHNGWWQANPFSLSAAPDGRHLRLTAKAVGTTSAGLRGLQPGSRVFVEGPYGAFTSMHQVAAGMLLVAGGVGVTPIRALLEESTVPTVVLYRVSNIGDAVLLRELQELCRQRGAWLQVLAGRTGQGNPPFAPFEPDQLAALVPDITRRDVYVCGPAAMTESVLRSLKVLKVPRAQIHAERFSLA
jgi:predicted ferric reductase